MYDKNELRFMTAFDSGNSSDSCYVLY